MSERLGVGSVLATSARLGVGSVLATSARIWWRNLPRLFAIVAVLFLPLAAWRTMQVSEGLESVIDVYSSTDKLASIFD